MKISSFLTMAVFVAGMATTCFTMTSCAVEDNAADEEIDFGMLEAPSLAAAPGSYIVEAKLFACDTWDGMKLMFTRCKNAGLEVINQNLNQDAGGKFIYLAVRRGSLLSKDQGSYISDFCLSNKKQPTLNVDGHTYTRVENDGDFDFDGNLNSNTKKGDNIYLYYTKEIIGVPMAVTEVTFDDKQTGNGVVGKEGQTTGDKNNVAFHGYNLNAKAGGQQIYMHLKTEYKPCWKVDAVANGGTTCTLDGFEGPTKDITAVAIPTTFNGMKVTACSNVSALKDLEVLNFYDLKNLGEFPSLSGCTKLKTFNVLDEGGNVVSTNVVPDYITTIGDSTFKKTAIASIELLGVTEVGVDAFWGCDDLKKVVFGRPAKVGSGAFSSIGSEKCEVTYPGTEASWDKTALLGSPHVAVVGKSDSNKPAYWGWCGGNIGEAEENGMFWHLEIAESESGEEEVNLHIACAIDDCLVDYPDNQRISNHEWETYTKDKTITNMYLNDVAYVQPLEFALYSARCVHLYPCLKEIGFQGFYNRDLKTVVYHGTQEQWDAVMKGDEWLYDYDDVKVEIQP